MAIRLESVGEKFGPFEFDCQPKDVMLYAVGVGCDSDELEFVYEQQLRTLPTFAVIPAFPALVDSLRVLEASPVKVLHGEQRTELYGEIPSSGKMITEAVVRAIYDKTKGALAVMDVDTFDMSKKKLFTNTYSLFVRGEGGFGGDRGPSAEKNVPPSRDPDKVVEYKTLPMQNLIYRLSGDFNPLHIDPAFAQMAGQPKPILHGLCTYGLVGRAVLHSYCDRDPAKFKSIEVRFSGVVFPGETVVTQMWEEGDKVVLQAKVAERDAVVISNAAAEVVK